MSIASVKRVVVWGISALALGQASSAMAQEAAAAPTDDSEIVVTAAKREQSVRDVSGSVSAVSEATLQKLNAQSLSDYITRVPGVVFNDYQPGVSEVVIRGIASTTYHEANQATTGYYLNQVPLIEPGFPLVIPDVDSFDVNRVEVLRGPQGTLFGSSSLGGAVNYVVNEADPGGFDAGFEGNLSSTKRAGEVNYGVKAMVNLPIATDKLAVRLVALQRVDAGYLDNTLLGEDGSNDLRVRGLRGSIVFTPTETTTLSALSMYQEYDLDDQTYVIFGPPKTFARATNVAEFQDTSFMLHSLKLEQDLGFATLTAIGSYTEKKANLAFDNSIFGGNDPRTGTPELASSNGKSKTEYGELRLASPDTGRFRWLIGANYTRLRSANTDGTFIEGIGDYIDANPGMFGGQSGDTLAPGDLATRTVSSNRVTEKAVFGEASFDIVDALTLTVGGRLFEYRSSPRLQYLPNANLIPPFDFAPGTSKDSDFIPKVSLTYKPNDDVMVYALYSEGFRIGGINVYSAAVPGLPLTFESDTTKNYEIGTRFDLIDKTLSVDVTAFHIDWGNVQARLFTPVTFNAYTVNGGGADVDGVEISLTLRPTRNLTFASNVTYNDARLSSLLPDSFAPGGGYAKGTQLPGASDWILANSIDLAFPDAPMKPRFGIAHRYMSAAPVAFGAALEKGDYHIVDLNASVTVADRVELGLFAKNLFNQYGILNAPFSFAGSVTRPRTLGATLRFSLN
ncbi:MULTISPECIES: TonB-dependent receptor [unclassified Sphingopyxis]|uniref:TonB-dependent receptor n=1 Tax=unclassified Sphingopyxis TaxID=2614943 RepID=UPI000A6FBB2C|nr:MULTISPECIES: TonB-dependent receptor [unclassified Sphingopyxis]